MLNNIAKEILKKLCLTQKREIKLTQNTNFLQNREIKVSRNLRTSKSRNKRVTKISCNKVTTLRGPVTEVSTVFFIQLLTCK